MGKSLNQEYKMKKMIMLLLLVVLPVMLFAQNTGLTSLEADFSYNLFPNELDAALNVGEAFSQLNNFYLFCGIGNLVKIVNSSAMTASATNLLWAGLFQPGTFPYSLFGGGYLETVPTSPASGMTYAWGAPVPVVSGTDTTNYQWITNQTDIQYEVPLFERLVKKVQFLTLLGQMNIGAYISLDLINYTNPTNNYTSIYTETYNTAGAGVAPSVANDYVRTTKYIDRRDTGTPANAGLRNTVELMVPVYVKNGTLEQFINAGASMNWTDRTTGYSGTNAPVSDILGGVPTDPADTLGGTFTNVENDQFTRLNSDLGINANYTLQVPGFFGGNAKDRFAIGVEADINVLNGTYKWEEFLQDVTFTPGAAAFTTSTRSESSTVYTLSPAINYDATLHVQHSFYFPLAGMAEFGIMPYIEGSYAMNQTSPDVASSVNIMKNDADADGLFTNALDSIITTTNSYTNTVMTNAGTVGNKSSIQTIKVNASLPSALKVKPAGWLFGLILGAEPYCNITYSLTTTSTAENSSIVNAVDGTGVVISNTNTNAESSYSTSTTGITYSMGLLHNAGAFFDLNEDVHLSVNINSSVAGGVWDIRNLIIQGIIKLPAKKA